MAFLLLLFVLEGRAQSKMIMQVLRSLPDQQVYGLSRAARDSMLKGTYYPSDNDSTSILAYNYGSSVFVKNYVYVSMSYETGQRGSGMIEIRAFPMKKGGQLIVVSRTGGVQGVTYHQQELSAFIYQHRKLTAYRKNLLTSMDEDNFMKWGVPDSVRREIIRNSNLSYDFSLENPALDVNSPYLLNQNSIKEWLRGDHIEYRWTGEKFLAGKPHFK